MFARLKIKFKIELRRSKPLLLMHVHSVISAIRKCVYLLGIYQYFENEGENGCISIYIPDSVNHCAAIQADSSSSIG